MPMHPVTSTLMYRGMCTIPDILSYSAPVNLPEDEVEGETSACVWGWWGLLSITGGVLFVCLVGLFVSPFTSSGWEPGSSCGGERPRRRTFRTLESARRSPLLKSACLHSASLDIHIETLSFLLFDFLLLA